MHHTLRVEASNSAFSGNFAGNDGGGVAGSVSLSNVVFAENQATQIGGAIFGVGTIEPYGNPISVTGNGVYIVENTAGSSDGGVSVTALYPGAAPFVISDNQPNNCSSQSGNCPGP